MMMEMEKRVMVTKEQYDKASSFSERLSNQFMAQKEKRERSLFHTFCKSRESLEVRRRSCLHSDCRSEVTDFFHFHSFRLRSSAQSHSSLFLFLSSSISPRNCSFSLVRASILLRISTISAACSSFLASSSSFLARSLGAT